jgi:hypothetical protein
LLAFESIAIPFVSGCVYPGFFAIWWNVFALSNTAVVHEIGDLLDRGEEDTD